MDHQSKRSKPARRPAGKAGPPSKPRRVVLLVDDDPDWRMLVRDALTQSDVAAHCPLDIHEVGDGEAALQYLFQLGRTSGNPLPSLIYLDCEMPRLDGVTMLSIIRRDPRLSRIPTVMLTGVADETEMRRASECGASAYIVKPPDVAELARVIAASAGYWLGLPGAPGPTNPMEQAA